MLFFTISSPISAIVTFYGFTFVGGAEGKKMMVIVGVFLLISAGTFLYVATIHILPEVYCTTETHRPHTHKHLPEDHVHDEDHFPKEMELIAMVGGVMFPFLLELLE